MSTTAVQHAYALALGHHQASRLKEAEVIYRQVLAVQPDHRGALHRLGIIAQQVGAHGEAVQFLSRAIQVDPSDAGAHSNLGEALRALRRFEEASDSLQRALELQPRSASAWLNLGNVHLDRGEPDEAIAAYQKALGFDPNLTTAHYNLGNAFREKEQLNEAIAEYRSFLEQQPNDAEAWNDLGVVLARRADLDAAGNAYRRALELHPNFATALSNLADVICHQGQVETAIPLFRRCVELQPQSSWMHSNLIYTLHFQPDISPEVIREEQRAWNRKFLPVRQEITQPRERGQNPDRRLRIGYVSADFRNHVVGRNLLPLFKVRNAGQFEVVCYSGVPRGDELTEEFRQCADQWRSTVGLTDEQVAGMIRDDEVDILVDLSQHLAGNRLPAFAEKPCPIQVSFAGYPESTGLETIEYRISDRWLEGKGKMQVSGHRPQDRETASRDHPESWDLHLASGLYLLESFWCYDPCGIRIATNELPADEVGHFTFGCLNNFSKVNEPLLRLWGRLLRQVPDSRLIILTGNGSHRGRIGALLESEGLAGDRVEFVDPRPRREYLELYHRIDIALDTFPYNGHTTSLDALWMGVPVVSLAGEAPVSRAGFSQLSNLGLPELVSFTEDDYVRIAVELANDRPRLADLRRTLRARMESSVLMDAPWFARSVETAYREMWRNRCAS